VHLSDISAWARSNGLLILLFVFGTALIARFVHWVAGRYIARIDAEARRRLEAGMVPSEDLGHLHSLVQAGEWLAVGVLYFVAFLLVMSKFDLPLTSLVAPATAIGAAIGFGAQRIVQDLLAGFFMFTERQYVFGDVVQIGQVGATTGVTGTVEEVTLRTTKLRTVQGDLVIIPNGQVNQVVNRSRDWARVIIDVPVAIDQDIERATEVMRGEVSALAGDPEWRKQLLDDPVVAGVESIDAGFLKLRVSARTLPAARADVGRELRRRIAQGLREAGIKTTAPLQ